MLGNVVLKNVEGDMAFVVKQPEALKHLNGMIGTCIHYSHIINQWYFDVPSGGTYMFKDDELMPIGGELVYAYNNKPVIKEAMSLC